MRDPDRSRLRRLQWLLLNAQRSHHRRFGLPSISTLHPQTYRTTQHRAAPLFAAAAVAPLPFVAMLLARLATEYDEGGVGIARQSGEPDRSGAREHRRAVQHDQAEGAAAQQDVGAPGGAGGAGWAHHPEWRFAPHAVPVPVSRRPVLRREGA